MRIFLAIAASVLLPCIAGAASLQQPNVVVQWNKSALQGVRDVKLGAPMVARALAVVHTCMYDAWAAYDDRAVGTQLTGALRRPAFERTESNKEKAGCPTHSRLLRMSGDLSQRDRDRRHSQDPEFVIILTG